MTNEKLNYDEKSGTITCNDSNAKEIIEADIQALINGPKGKLVKSNKKVKIDFSMCTMLKIIKFPEKLSVEISNDCFKYFKDSLTIVEIPNCTKVGIDAFYQCSNLQTVNLPKCTKIHESSFENCPKLKTVNLPKNIINHWSGSIT